MDILQYMNERVLFADGGMGTMLQSTGLAAGRSPEQWNMESPEKVRAVHDAYIAAGARLITGNTFGGNAIRQKRSKVAVPELVAAGMRLARAAADAAPAPCFAALDVGPLGTFLAPLGTLSAEEATAIFSETVEAGKADADCVIIETMCDVAEAVAATTAAKRCCALPIFATMSFDANGRLMTGCRIEDAVRTLADAGVDAVGCNCGVGPEVMPALLARIRAVCTLPVIISPNAGLPRYDDGQTVYDLSPADYAAAMRTVFDGGARVLGGCCGTTPAHIRAMVDACGMV